MIYPVHSITEPGFVNQRMVDSFKIAIALWALSVGLSDVRVEEAISTEVDDHATDMVAWLQIVAETAVGRLEGHFVRIFAFIIIK